MSASEDLKILLVRERTTMTELARLASLKSKKPYTIYGISQKLARNSMKYDEVKFLARVLGYRLKYERIEDDSE